MLMDVGNKEIFTPATETSLATAISTTTRHRLRDEAVAAIAEMMNRISEVLQDTDKARALAGKLQRLAYARQSNAIARQDQENAALEDTRLGKIVNEMRKGMIFDLDWIRELEADEFAGLLDSVDLNGDDSTTHDKQLEFLLFKRIQEQIYGDQAADDNRSDSIAQDPTTIELLALDDLKQRKQSYLHVLPTLDDEIEQAKQELAREDELFVDSTQMKEGINDRIIDIYSSSAEVTPEQYFNDLRRKIRSKHTEHNNLSLELEDTVLAAGVYDDEDEAEDENREDVEDIRRYFMPAENSENGRKRTKQEEREEFLLLLSDLLQAMDETPVDPYINVSEYYEGVRIKIVESGIAVEHPTDSARLRLHDFHKTFDDGSDGEEGYEEEDEDARRELLDYYGGEGDDLSEAGEIGEDEMAI
ncbi:hypothetical protein E3P94_03283 [Wallemia ichthyophaga]|nr:hypothetical protein E3P98_03320 [Wallemia ichthyophaga]TIA97496.1 hypothetical protein E3P94_03283 [Wallemia ichthyophaga]TIA98558.1 hypothetical protein E3P95_02390 [Wallemia ichthyophaga]